MKNKLTIRKYIGYLTFLLVVGGWMFVNESSVFAQTPAPAGPTPYKLLAPIPGYIPTTNDATTAKPYIQGIFTLIIAIAGVLAVVKIMFGGIQYMSTDAYQGKSDAKDSIQNAILGLLLAISAWLILYTVNPNLVNFNLNIPAQKIPTYPTPGGGTGGTGEAIGTGPNHLALTAEQAKDAFGTEVGVDGNINLVGIRQGTVDEVLSLKRACNCTLVVTSATGGEHAGGACSHANGYKVDLRSKREGIPLTNYVQGHYQQLPNRKSDGAQMYQSPSGAKYALEGNHWDVSIC